MAKINELQKKRKDILLDMNKNDAESEASR